MSSDDENITRSMSPAYLLQDTPPDQPTDEPKPKDAEESKPDPAEPSSPAASTPKLNLCHWIILMSLNTIGSFSSDAYVPNLDTIGDDLHASDASVSLTIQINWIMLGLWNPVIGHVSDRFGRKPVIYVALVVYCIGAVGSALTPSIEWLIVARTVQGCGEAVSVITTAVIRDVCDDMDERMKLMAFFSMMRPVMLLAAPVVGGGIADFLGWRALFWILAGWGALTLLLVFWLIPESNSPTQADSGVAAKETTFGHKLHRMWKDRDFIDLTLVAAFYMGAVRSMLSNISFVYEDFYDMSSFATGLLISVPTGCGFFSSLAAIGVVRKHSTMTTLRAGMLAAWLAPACMIVAAGLPGCVDCPFTKELAFVSGTEHGWGSAWWVVTGCVAVMAATGFFALPAMQTVVMQHLKDMSGLAGGLSKMLMQFTSTGMSMVASAMLSHHSEHDAYSVGQTQKLLYILAVMLLICQLYYWLFYSCLWPSICPTKQADLELPKEHLLEGQAPAATDDDDYEEYDLFGSFASASTLYSSHHDKTESLGNSYRTDNFDDDLAHCLKYEIACAVEEEK
jgi:DHA1 family bicyclomycin/chloramphenicol resistance-like MFS transporter